MKKIALVVSALFIGGGALADSAPTSVGYVDSQISALQNKISAVDTNTVLTRTNTAGEIGQKSIYDATGNYATQTDALVTAEVANAAVQNAIDSEFVCTEWLDGAPHTNENCFIYTVRNTTPNRIVPDGYTPLEYIESTGTQYIDTGCALKNTTGIYMEIDDSNKHQPSTMAAYFIGTGASNKYRYYGYFLRNNKTSYWAWNGQNASVGEGQMGSNIQTNYSHLYINYMNDRKYIYSNGTDNIYVQNDLPEINVEQTKSLYLFAINQPNTQDNTAAYFSVGKLYKLKLSENQTIVHNLIPARRDSDNAIGMYDTVNNQFLTNSGTGKFIAGPEIDANIYVPTGN